MEIVTIENAIIGAGVIGLAIGAELSRRGEVAYIFDVGSTIGSGISSRNSEVIHSGIYYPEGSLKSRFCLEGSRLLYKYCEEKNIPHRKSGKLVVASNQQDADKLAVLAFNAKSCGIKNLQMLDSGQVQRIEPSLKAYSALSVTETGIIDSHRFMAALAYEIIDAGGAILLRHRIKSFRCFTNGFEILILTPDGELLVKSTRLIIAAGLFSHELMTKSDGLSLKGIPPLVFAKGSYFAFVGQSNFTHLIYPIPEDGGLGVHLTFDLAGQVRFGPDVEWLTSNNPNEIDFSIDDRKSELFYEAIRKYWPSIPDGSLTPAYAGVRPKLSKKGEPPRDFVLLLPLDNHLMDLPRHLELKVLG